MKKTTYYLNLRDCPEITTCCQTLFGVALRGDTVNLAACMEQNSEAGKVNISNSIYELVKDLPAGQAGKFTCIHRGKIDAKNKGVIDMYFAENNAK